MRYNQYVEFEKLLKENNLTVDDVRENPEVLNEIGIVGGIIVGVLGVAGILFRKYILSWGIKGIYIKKLDNMAKWFKNKTFKHVSAIGKKSIKYRQGLVAKGKKIEHLAGPEAEEEQKVIKQHKANWDTHLSKEINGFINRTVNNKTKEINLRIDNLKRVKSGHKVALKNYWERLVIDIKLAAYQKLSEDGIITDPEILKTYEQQAEDEKDEARFNLKRIKQILFREKGEEKRKDKEKKEKEDKEKDTLQYKIDKLSNQKGMLSSDDFLRKLRMILVDAKKIEDSVEQKEITDLLTQKFGVDTLKDAYASRGEGEGLEPEDNF